MSVTTRPGQRSGAPARTRRTRHIPRRPFGRPARPARPERCAPWHRWGDLRTWRPYAAVLALLTVAIIGIGATIYFTSWFGVKTVAVSPTRYVTAAQVRAAAAVPPHRSLARVDTAAIAARVRHLAPVASVSVTRSWPSTITITVTERRPVAYTVTGHQIWLLDRYGRRFFRAPRAPAGLVRIDERGAGAAVGGSPAAVEDADRAAVAVAAELPPSVVRLVTAVTAPSQDAVTIALRSGRTVVWGTAAQSEAKLRVLPTLLQRTGTTFDLSGFPTIAVRSGR